MVAGSKRVDDQQPTEGTLSSTGTVKQVSKQNQWVDLVTIKKGVAFQQYISWR